MVLRPLTAEQTAAFYEARGFPGEAIDIITTTCFVTVHVRNRSRKVIWLDTGRWRFVHFWASWCGPCRREMPGIQRLLPLIADTGIEIVLVDTAETEDEVFTFLGIVAPDLVPLLDVDGLVTEAWQPRGLPATFLVDPDGQIRYQALGGRSWYEPAYVEFLQGLGKNPDPE